MAPETVKEHRFTEERRRRVFVRTLVTITVLVLVALVWIHYMGT